MKQILSLSTLIFLFSVSSSFNAEAQTERQLKGKETMVKKSTTMQKPTSVNSRISGRPSSPYSNETVLDLSDTQKAVAINGYKVDYLGKKNTGAGSLVSIAAFAGDKEQKAILNFYNDLAKAQKEGTKFDVKGNISLAYPMSMLNPMLDLFSSSKKVKLVFDQKNNDAYFTTDLVPTRSR